MLKLCASGVVCCLIGIGSSTASADHSHYAAVASLAGRIHEQSCTLSGELRSCGSSLPGAWDLLRHSQQIGDRAARVRRLALLGADPCLFAPEVRCLQGDVACLQDTLCEIRTTWGASIGHRLSLHLVRLERIVECIDASVCELARLTGGLGSSISGPIYGSSVHRASHGPWCHCSRCRTLGFGNHHIEIYQFKEPDLPVARPRFPAQVNYGSRSGRGGRSYPGR